MCPDGWVAIETGEGTWCADLGEVLQHLAVLSDRAQYFSDRAPDYVPVIAGVLGLVVLLLAVIAVTLLVRS